MTKVAAYVADRIRRPMPLDAHVVPGSTPVVSFGDPKKARVATIGINPSSREFCTAKGTLLPMGKKRLVDLPTLGATATETLSDQQVAAVVDGCTGYFDRGSHPHRNPYDAWFKKLDLIIEKGFGASFYSKTACHLDLVQWATNPVWGSFPRTSHAARDRLLREDVEFLERQLRDGQFFAVYLNGRSVIEWVQRAGLVTLEVAGKTPVGKQGKQADLVVGTIGSTKVFGCSLNSSHSQTTHDNREKLGAWISGRAGS